MNKFKYFMLYCLMFVFTKNLFSWDFTTYSELVQSLGNNDTVLNAVELRLEFEKIKNDELCMYDALVKVEKYIKLIKDSSILCQDQKNYIFMEYIPIFWSVFLNRYFDYEYIFDYLLKQLENLNLSGYQKHYGGPHGFLLDSAFGNDLPFSYYKKIIDLVGDVSIMDPEILMDSLLSALDDHKDIEIVQYLIDKGAEVNVRHFLYSKYDDRIHDLVRDNLTNKELIENDILSLILENLDPSFSVTGEDGLSLEIVNEIKKTIDSDPKLSKESFYIGTDISGVRHETSYEGILKDLNYSYSLD